MIATVRAELVKLTRPRVLLASGVLAAACSTCVFAGMRSARRRYPRSSAFGPPVNRQTEQCISRSPFVVDATRYPAWSSR